MKVNPGIVTGLVILHVGALLAPFTFSWPGFWLFLSLFSATVLSVTFCFHRLLTHRSFECPKFLEYFMVTVAAVSSQGDPIRWVSTHRYHHIHSDLEGDCHSPRHGFWWAHFLWFIYKSPDWEGAEFEARYAPDLVRDPYYKFLKRFGWLGQWILGGVLFLWGGLSFLVWGTFLRTVAMLHVTWFVNSASHKWGYRTYETKDDSKNLWWVALLGFGEGWHNNHHAFQNSAAHGLRWWEVDMTYWLIRFLSIFGLTRNIKLPTPAQLASSRPLNSEKPSDKIHTLSGR